MSDAGSVRFKIFRWPRWGPAQYALDRDRADVVVGEQVVSLDLRDRRSAMERQAGPDLVSPLSVGMAVEWNGRRVAMLRDAAGSPLGFVRRSRDEHIALWLALRISSLA